MPVDPTKVKACKAILFTEGTPEVEIKIISQFCRIGKGCDQNGNRMSENEEILTYLVTHLKSSVLHVKDWFQDTLTTLPNHNLVLVSCQV